ncbi:MAG: 16S rRNA (guanine(527)-N(7))-methyltransferase RsmG [Ferruginibacter sp.]
MDVIEKYFTAFSLSQLKQFEALLPAYQDWNQKINVISRKDTENFYLHHVLHSLAIATQFEFTPGMQVMDLGSGGGFPGIPLAIFFPEINFLLVDSINKKLVVAESIADAVGLKNITVKHSRAEDIKDRKFDAIVSRAVAPLKDLWYWSKPLLKKNKSQAGIPNGLICLKGGDLGKEISESRCKPRAWDIETMFEEPYFKEKYLLYQPVI